MAKKLLEQDEAARMLGITVDRLNELRDRGKLFPKRDGADWKYNEDDLLRYQQDLADEQGGGNWETIGLDAIQLEENTDPDSILLNEVELGQSPETKSTIIGRNKTPAESDIKLAGESDLKIKTDEGTKSGIGGSDLNLQAGGSSLFLEGESKSNTGSGTMGGSSLFEDIQLENLGTHGGSDSLKLASDSMLGDDPSDTRKGKKSSDSNISLDNDDELVLGGTGSDITLGAADSGIMLVDPADSGLALDSPLQLPGSSSKHKFDDDMIIGEDDVINLEDQIDMEGATQLRSSEDFDLTPGGVGFDEDSESSGSQVIALESEEDMGAGGSGGMFGGGMLEEEPISGGVPLADAMSPGMMPGAAPGMMQMASMPEAPYSVFNVLCLAACVFILALGGIMVYDLSQHIWSWDTPYQFNSGLMDTIGFIPK